MQYRKMGKTGDLVSVLGFGCMRFPSKNGKIDEEKTEKQIVKVIEKGVNYFDTAYIYPGSEVALGNILSKGYREKVFIATKLPPFLVNSYKDMEKIFENQLKRLKTDYIDYYLVHSINSKAGWNRMKSLGVVEFLNTAKLDGKIKHVGFSYHGESHEFKDIVDDYPWEFCQIQYNYMDENVQAGKEGLLYAASKGMGISVMEPLRGGRLAVGLPDEALDILKDEGIDGTPAELALKWIWNHEEVTLLLSGMNEDEQIEENLETAEKATPNSMMEKELSCIKKVRDKMNQKIKVGCTSCGYCMPCPFGVNIPMCFSYYNDKYIYETKSIRLHYIGMLSGADGGKPGYASLCVNCGKCESHCPQHIKIRNELKNVSLVMEPFYFKAFAGFLSIYYKLRNLLRSK